MELFTRDYMPSAEACPCVVRVFIPPVKCQKLLRISNMRLADSNELKRYIEIVVDDEIRACQISSIEKSVDCIANCKDDEIGVEFTSWISVEELIKKFDKVAGSRKCGEDIKCIVVAVIPAEQIDKAREALGRIYGRSPVVTQEDLGKLKDVICQGSHTVVLFLINDKGGYRECKGKGTQDVNPAQLPYH